MNTRLRQIGKQCAATDSTQSSQLIPIQMPSPFLTGYHADVPAFCAFTRDFVTRSLGEHISTEMKHNSGLTDHED